MCKNYPIYNFYPFHLPLCHCVIIRYFSGVIPTIFLNALKNDCLLPNPTISPMSSTEYASKRLSLKCRIASFTLYPCTTSTYPIPYSILTILDKCHRDTPSISAKSPAENLGSLYFLPLISISSICPFNAIILLSAHKVTYFYPTNKILTIFRHFPSLCSICKVVFLLRMIWLFWI